MDNSTVEQKLDTLYELQQIDVQIDRLHKIKGDLPDEVQDLEDELAQQRTRINKQLEEVKGQDTAIFKLKQAIKDAEKLITKYQEQQMNVRNNREYDAINKEIEIQQLDIQLFEKRIKEAHQNIDQKNLEIQKIKDQLAEREKDLEAKKAELQELIKESEGEERELEKKKDKMTDKFEDKRLLRAYNRIRTNVKNGLAVVKVQRGACGGCFAMVPPQKQSEIKERKKILVCEHCGRIFCGVQDTDVEEPVEKKRTIRSKAAKV